jgi:hypothetical protein
LEEAEGDYVTRDELDEAIAPGLAFVSTDRQRIPTGARAVEWMKPLLRLNAFPCFMSTPKPGFVRCRFPGVNEIRDPNSEAVYYPEWATAIFELPDHVYLAFLRERATKERSVKPI